jgi:hypothetical protein
MLLTSALPPQWGWAVRQRVNHGWQTVSAAGSDAPFEGALIKVDRFATFCTGVGLVEFVGKNLLALAAFGTLANKGFKVFKALVAGTVLRGGHSSLLFFYPIR